MTAGATHKVCVHNVAAERNGFRALTNISFEVGPGQLIGVVGPNGGGKSTLFDTVAGVLPAVRGEVEVSGELAYVPQRDSINWHFPATVLDVVMMGRYHKGGWFHRTGKRDREIARDSLERVGLWERRGMNMIDLSGGQRQRVFIARALAQEASILLLDETFSGVDVGAQDGIIRVLQGLRDEGRIVMLATHDLTNMAERFDLILCLNRHVCAFGPPRETFNPLVLEELYGSHGVDLERKSHVHA